MQLEEAAFAERVDPALLPEWMDGPCSYDELRACLVDLEQVNRVTLAHRATLAWLGAMAKRGETLRVLDFGCGGGDMVRHIARWARRRGVEVELLGVDINAQAIEVARERSRGLAIEWIAGDACEVIAAGGVDCVISSLVMHHLRDEEIVDVLAWMELAARRGWFVNDLYRSARAYQVFAALARLMRWHRFVQHDGPVSIRRAFREADWKRLCAQAGVGPVRIEKVFPSRLCVGRVK
jgi:2-polyprenyl-3-methyl-5-hydroxy-6-metoxy-1,4-benzoquinol methylase